MIFIQLKLANYNTLHIPFKFDQFHLEKSCRFPLNASCSIHVFLACTQIFLHCLLELHPSEINFAPPESDTKNAMTWRGNVFFFREKHQCSRLGRKNFFYAVRTSLDPARSDQYTLQQSQNFPPQSDVEAKCSNMHSIVLRFHSTHEIKQDKLVPENNSCCPGGDWRFGGMRNGDGCWLWSFRLLAPPEPETTRATRKRYTSAAATSRCCGTNGQPSGNSGSSRRRCRVVRTKSVQLGAEKFSHAWPQGVGFELMHIRRRLHQDLGVFYMFAQGWRRRTDYFFLGFLIIFWFTWKFQKVSFLCFQIAQLNVFRIYSGSF